MATQSASVVAPPGWLVLVEDNHVRSACSVECFDVVWGQRKWREGQKDRAMEELPVEESRLY